ncbi:TraR/DksA family transcriptional regulator [Desulfurivibrio sp. D14AmB]|uniref:TraR/DksA family transcriptional regulator n=1 Tax=Desulfurivibrio sp. D14AmB TaxID=3374370 RepID=UPI00376EAF76
MGRDLDLEYFKQRLEDRLAVIKAEQEAARGESAPRELDQECVGRLSRMDAMQQQAISRAGARLAGQERQRIEAALGRIKRGDYGYCMQCDDEIAEGRLRVDPSSLVCLACAREAENL